MSPRLELDEYKRYGRQMILDGFGLDKQLDLKQSSVVVVGAGGLGCSALQYLAAVGIGRIGIIDHDMVELSNLQRQILHKEQTLGSPKAISAAQALRSLNSRVVVDAIVDALTPSNAVALLGTYDVILDCTDNAPARYLLSDAAVYLGKPLVSGAAQKYDGQVCTYNLGADGPCYRCLFPKPPAPELTGTCEEIGILGVVTGVIGNLQALEAIKIVTGMHDHKPSLLFFSALGSPQFRSVKLRSRKPACLACSQIGIKSGKFESFNYVQFCGGPAVDWESRGLLEVNPQNRIEAKELKTVMDAQDDVTIIDVRRPVEFGICHLPGSINIPLADLVSNPASHLQQRDTYIVCRLGNDSQIAADALRGVGKGFAVKDLIGGLAAWTKEIDNQFPVY